MTRVPAGSFGTVAAVNGHFLISASCGTLAWFIWPQTPEWWGLGVIAVVLGAASLIDFAKALRGIVRLHLRDRAVAAFEALGEPPKSSRVASSEALAAAGMIDDEA